MRLLSHRSNSVQSPWNATTPPPVVLRIHTQVDCRLEWEWGELAAATSRGFGARPSYALSWFRELGKGQMSVATLHRGGQLVGLLPLHRRRRMGLTVHRWLGHGLGTVGEGLFHSPGDAKTLLAGLRRRGMLLELTHLCEDSPLFAAVQEDPGWHSNFHLDEYCPVIDLPAGTRAATLRSTKTLGQLRRARARVEKEHGAVGFQVLQTPAEFRGSWSELVRVAQVARAADPDERGNLFDGEYAAFARYFLNGEAASGNLCVLGIQVGGRWVGFQVLLCTAGKAELWFTRYDPDFSALKPGHQIIEYLCDHHEELGIDTFDTMIGRNAYKGEWATSGYEVGTLIAAPAHLRGALGLLQGINGGYDLIREGAGRLRNSSRGAALNGV